MVWVSSTIGQNSHLVQGSSAHALSVGYGETARAGWSEDAGALAIISDPLGLAPLYYFEADQTFVCSDRISELFNRGAKPEPDPVLLSLNLALSFCPADLTIFQGIKRVAPGARITRSARGTAIGQRLDVPAPLELTRAEAVIALGERFESGLEVLTRKAQPLSIPLSGGRDSRHIFLACQRLGRSFETMTFTNFPPGAQDVEIATLLSKRVGYRHRVQRNSEHDYHAAIVKALGEVNFETVQHGWIWSLLDLLGKAGAPFCDGLAGDVLSNNLFFSFEINNLLKQKQVDEVVARTLPMAVSRLPAEMKYERAVLDRIGELLHGEFSRWLAWPNPHKAYLFFNRTRRSIAAAPLALSRLSGLACIFPFLEKSTFDLLMGLSDQVFVSETRFHDEVIAKRYPEYMDVPFGTRNKNSKLGYLASVKNVLPYLRPSGDSQCMTRSNRREIQIGIWNVLTGSDFCAQQWRFARRDLADSLAWNLQNR